MLHFIANKMFATSGGGFSARPEEQDIRTLSYRNCIEHIRPRCQYHQTFYFLVANDYQSIVRSLTLIIDNDYWWIFYSIKRVLRIGIHLGILVNTNELQENVSKLRIDFLDYSSINICGTYSSIDK